MIDTKRTYTSFNDFLDWEAYPNLKLDKLLPHLSPQDDVTATRVSCPGCHRRTASILKGTGRIKCPKEMGCGFNRTLVEVLAFPKRPQGPVYRSIVRTLAANAGREIPAYLLNPPKKEKEPRKKHRPPPSKPLSQVKFQTLDEWEATGNKIKGKKPSTILNQH